MNEEIVKLVMLVDPKVDHIEGIGYTVIPHEEDKEPCDRGSPYDNKLIVHGGIHLKADRLYFVRLIEVQSSEQKGGSQ